MSDLRFDFMADLRAIYSQKLSVLGHSVEATMQTGEVLARYFSHTHRQIDRTARQVLRSKEVLAHEQSLAPELRQAISQIEALSAAAGDLNPYQSRDLAKKPWKPDPQLLEWGITHFHLGIGPDPKHPNLIAGTAELLFVVVRPDALYLVEVGDHNSFSDQAVFDVAIRNWPNLERHSKFSMDVVGLSHNPTSQERDVRRKEHVNTLTQGPDGCVYAPVGGGMTGSGTPVPVMLNKVIPLVKFVRRLERRCKASPEEFLAGIPEKARAGLSTVNLCLIETPQGKIGLVATNVLGGPIVLETIDPPQA